MVKNGKTKKKYHKPTKPHHHSSPPAAQENKPITVKTLPAHLILEIFYRTPVKSLLLLGNSRRGVALLGLDQSPVTVFNIDRNFTTRPNYPRKINFTDFSKNMVVAGSINGIVCLAHFKEMLGRYVALWNPGVNCWSPIELVEDKSFTDGMSVGFGYDAVSDDYKIICIVPALGDFGWSFLQVYSANRGCWVDVGRGGILPFCADKGLRHCNFIIRGVPYWVGIDEGDEATPDPVELLGKIDPCTNSYFKILYPRHVKNKCTKVYPVNLRDSVAALIHSPGECPNEMVDLYVLDENTAKWTKMYSIGPFAFEGLWIPQCFSTGEIVLETWTGNKNPASSLVTYFCDPKTNLVVPNTEIEALGPLWYESFSHVESLVRIKGMVQIGKEHKDRKKTNSKIKNRTEFLSKEFDSVLHL
ncbi:hypothetical protein POM88_034063 [Heracleum sosnowskyi]|uniref:F-box protein n=1 Tax=Heracleum sosnowskyi TaxID=360622 RepID=A0AAD8HIT8_9APIA|nr:hypothetical protein POM88_034063 [Heracleum sosnowskyi]